MFGLFVAFLLCVPNIHMTKAQFLECVKPYRDEYHVAQQRGVPQRIEKKTPGDPSEAQYDWVYRGRNGETNTLTFNSMGELVVEAVLSPRSPR